MCGIAGAVAVEQGIAVDRRPVERALDLMTHRGPDARGVRCLDGAILGHVRLAIVDDRRQADQPMGDTSGRVWLAYNGEVFNFQELRRDLERLGHRFRTRSDTEVVLEAYLAWGLEAVPRLDGQFAFAVVDLRDRSVHLVRDRLGIKPLNYARVGDLLVFASELRAVAGWPGFERRLNPVAASSFLSYRYVLGEESYFRGAYRLPPASILTLRNGSMLRGRYWRLDLDSRRLHAGAGAAERAANLAGMIHSSVRRQLPSGCPPALLLSGGIDSSILAFETRRVCRGPVVAYTARLQNDAYDESAFAREVATAFSLDHRLVDLSPGAHLDLARELVERRGEPLAMHNEVGMYALAKNVAREAKVVLCGEGADELFSGYGRISRSPFDRARACWAQVVLGRAAGPLLDRLEVDRDAHLIPETEHFLRRYDYFGAQEKMSLFRPEIRAAVGADAELQGEFARVFERGAHLTPYERVALALFELHLPGLLGMVDGVTMAAGVEARVPFLDHRIVQAAFDLPAEDRLRWRHPLAPAVAAWLPIRVFSERLDQTKVVLRRAYGLRLPRTTLRRRKAGFAVPLGTWLRAELRPARELLLSSDARTAELFDGRRLTAWLERQESSFTDAVGKKLWLLLGLELYLRQW